ncbi:biotin/lipoyl-binding protein [Pseudoroseomonas wenyumeiae]|uniref:Biotin/lipoyl-binding protein n=1 Tax=Teichococcus wenyumeiae TaxID=2478470 RepID=A0A3A9J731_9PROT|nr:HlyD family secretion protein [Pseudoroseomonas wenyumeiae]RKK03027.1 HlyD family secretion protein [Pseudoroseomonas wenyumeiae]RMI15521.1 biotin/lipoyl-binding protein [Pseudoroseomonas wenyumeiae]
MSTKSSGSVALPPVETGSRKPALVTGIGVVVLLSCLVGWYAAADRWTPYSGTGAVAGYVAQVAPQVSGPVTEVLVEDNSRVTAGSPLFRIDPTLFELAVRQMEAELAQTLQATSAGVAGIAAAEAQVAQANAALQNTRAVSSRTLQLVERGVYPQARADDARGDLRTAEAASRAAEAQRDQAARQLGSANSDNPQLVAATARLQKARTDLLNTTVLAATDGVVTNLSLTVGQYAAAGQPLLTVIDSRGGWLVADYRENQLRNIDAGDPVEIAFDVAPGHIFRGRVQSLAWGIDTGRLSSGGLAQPQANTRWFEPARRVPVRIEMALDEAPPKVRIGAKVSLVVNADGGNAGLLWWIAQGLMRASTLLSYLY